MCISVQVTTKNGSKCNAKTKHYLNGYTNTIVSRGNVFQPIDYAESDRKVLNKYLQREFEYELIYKWYGLHHDHPLKTKYFQDQTNLHNISIVHDRVKRTFRFRQMEKLRDKLNKGTTEPRYDSLKRAKDSVFDYVLNNEWQYFFTFTFNPTEVDSLDPVDVKNKVQKWLKNMVTRKGLRYIMVAEHHKSGRIHFHGLLYCVQEIPMTYSGTQKYKGFKKPVRDERAIQLGLSDGTPVYNLQSWKFGFSTCIKCFGDPCAMSFYITKYIVKDSKQIFGKFYWHSQNISKPVVTYSDVDFESFDALDYNGYKYRFEKGGDTSDTKRDIDSL